MRTFKLIVGLIFIISNLGAQDYFTRTGHVHVLSENKLKNIEADNYQVISTLDAETGKMIFEGLLKSFEFKFGAIDRAFNSKKLDVNKYPKIRFEGKLLNVDRIDFTSAGQYDVEVDGVLYIWDEKRITKASGIIVIGKDMRITAMSSFIMRIEEQSVNKLNDLMKKKLPEVININTNTLGVSRNIIIDLDLTYKKKNW